MNKNRFMIWISIINYIVYHTMSITKELDDVINSQDILNDENEVDKYIKNFFKTTKELDFLHNYANRLECIINSVCQYWSNKAWNDYKEMTRDDFPCVDHLVEWGDHQIRLKRENLELKPEYYLLIDMIMEDAWGIYSHEKLPDVRDCPGYDETGAIEKDTIR